MKSLRKAGSNEICTVLGDEENLDPVRSAVDPEAYDDYRRLWDEASALETVTDFPIQLDFELNYSCNFSCPMCTWSAETTSNIGRDTWFPFEVWKELIDEAVPKGLKSIRLNQMNEPMIRQDIVKFVEYARNAGILDIYFSSNGSLLSEKMSRGLIEAGLMRLQISLDAATKETYDKIRIGGDYHKIIRNIDRFLEIREEMGTRLPLLRVNFVRVPENIHELDMFTEMWKDKADLIGIQDVLGIMEKYDKSKKEGYDSSVEKFNCAQPYQRMTVRSNGHILPCCLFHGIDIPVAKLKHGIEGVEMKGDDGIFFKDDEARKRVSSLMIRSIEEAWNSDEMKYFRDIHKKGEYWRNPSCKKCVESSYHTAEN